VFNTLHLCELAKRFLFQLDHELGQLCELTPGPNLIVGNSDEEGDVWYVQAGTQQGETLVVVFDRHVQFVLCAIASLRLDSLCFFDAFEHKTSGAFTQAAHGAHVGQVLGLKSSVAASAALGASWSWRSRM